MLAYLLHGPAAAPYPSPFRSPPAVVKTPFFPSPVRTPPPRRAAAFSFSATAVAPITASLLQGPVLVWAGRLCLYYALLHVGLAGSPRNPFLSHEIGGEDGAGDSDLGFSKWAEKLRGTASGDKEAQDKRKLTSKWKPTTKGTLKRTYRVRSTEEGRRILKEIASVLSQDDHFVDASSHKVTFSGSEQVHPPNLTNFGTPKGCQIRRESAHGESVCCYNVRALFDELPTPHLVLEITPFPAGHLTDNDYRKAERLEMVLRLSASI
ncbi:hypothetical protein PR202_gb21591 [Eleusine coracana subsp. coracana]|uniref:Uncharacterized protein n=1 Tax=Eleusine coracana subsp. coracana TaxID=191504 RepID=A0AAV5FE00_ELECO|nr:hypothetical protein PR202_gb21591 [Eleusine coracana subsp. coracana]